MADATFAGRRHDLVRLHANAWEDLLVARPDLVAIPLARDWIEQDRPLIVRARQTLDPTGLAPLGLPLPPSAGKARLAIAVPRSAIRTVEAPPRLARMITVAPASWRSTIETLVALDPDTRTFGSLAWTYLTGLNYLGETSDLDLLWRLGNADDVARRLHGLAALSRTAPMKIDGEFVAWDGSGVQWRELLTATDLLVRGPEGPRLIDKQSFLDAV